MTDVGTDTGRSSQGEGRGSAFQFFSCWSCGKKWKADRGMQKWLKENQGNDPRPLGPCCAHGGYFGGS